MLQDSDEEEDAIDDYIYGVLDDKKDMIQEKMDGFQRAFMGQDQFIGTDESDELIKKLQQENALDAKYEQFIHKRDEDLEKRYHALKKDAPSFSNTTYSDSSKPKGSIPKPLTNTDLHDEMDDWCCKYQYDEMSDRGGWGGSHMNTQVSAMTMLLSSAWDARMTTSIAGNAFSIRIKVNLLTMKRRSIKADHIR